MKMSLYGLNFYLFKFILEGAGNNLEGIQVIKTAFSFLFKVKLFQLLFWLDFESVNEKQKLEGEVQKKGERGFGNGRLQDKRSTCMSRKQSVKEPVVSQGCRPDSSPFCVVCL